MSAFVVDKRHIDALLTAALELSGPEARMRYLAPGEPEDTDYERGEPWGRTAVANARARVRYLTHENLTQVGRMLLFENMRSVGHRYDESFGLPEYEYECGKILTPVQVLKALRCFEYQSCEHPGWHGSEGKAFCDALRDVAIRELPGYDEAEWEVTG